MQKKDIAVSIILTIVTCGIYGIVWFIRISDDLNYLCHDNRTTGGMAFLLTLVTCGIYGIYWIYLWGERIDNLREMRGLSRGSNGIIYLLLSIFGLSIVSYALCQDEINKHIDNTVTLP